MNYIRFLFVLYWFAPFLKFGPLPPENRRCVPEMSLNITISLNIKMSLNITISLNIKMSLNIKILVNINIEFWTI